VILSLFVGLVVSAVLVGKYLNQQKGKYVTRKDEGANNAFDADTAVLLARTGHQVESKKKKLRVFVTRVI
jgi:hypothetical protein